ncbi:hypothetical protein [Pseudomonas sp. SCB32]|uniref:hypothetical protein n=1 Tax=Pseudomonas sp. SCB32 TaxID=2653853 RepID=UPI0012656698|nr:hypothetical protein [Pseudomonas sp. SCB32]
MADADDSLWNNSPAWRWTLCLTLLASALVVLCAPWKPPAPTSTASAQYSPTVAPQTAPVAGAVMGVAATIQTPRLGPPPSRGTLDPALDTPVPLPLTAYSANTRLHVIGVYQGATPADEDHRPWWDNCRAFSDDPEGMMACHSKYANRHPSRTITVYLNDTSGPMVLALMAYEPIRWRVVSRPAVDLRKVILTGYYGPEIEGLPDSVPVEARSYERPRCQQCQQQPGYFYAFKEGSRDYDQAMTQLQNLTGLTPASFQGAYTGERFTIGSGMNTPTGAGSVGQLDAFTGRSFSNHVEIDSRSLLLPDGLWQARAYVKTPSSRGSDHLLVLSKGASDQLSELMVIHLQTAKDNQGFSQYKACNLPADYVKKVPENVPLGPQLCYWSNHVSAPWQQPIYRLAATRLTESGIALPDSAVSTGFHKADSGMSVTTLYYVFPESQTQNATTGDWDTSPWNPKLIDKHPDNASFINQRLDWAADWFQIFSAAH